MKSLYRIALLLRRKGFIIVLLSLLIMSGCATFDPRPYHESFEKVRAINDQTEGYQNRWHDGLIKHLELLPKSCTKNCQKRKETIWVS